ncbi:MAG TPA: hypothetical protein VHD32_10925 [Candidatus Didemnitutus sp.]|nr:hypothetical protein [Candidatus Didemnitutus sp.]
MASEFDASEFRHVGRSKQAGERVPQGMEVHPVAAGILDGDAACCEILCQGLGAGYAAREHATGAVHAFGFLGVQGINQLGQERDHIGPLGLGDLSPQFEERLECVQVKICPQQLLHLTAAGARAAGKKVTQ